jgi:hypothetical protein
MEPVKDWYVTFFGGRSPELQQGQVGINSENLENTRLTPYVDRVYIRRLSETKRIPLYVRESYEVVPLDEDTPDALSKSPLGEAVLPEEHRTWRRPTAEELRLKEPLILNNVLSRVAMGTPRDVARILTASYILKRGGLR